MEELKEWIAYVYMGCFVGTLGFLGYVGVAELIAFVMKWTHHFIDNDNKKDENGNEIHGVFLPFVVFVGFSTLYGFLGTLMTGYYA